MILTESDLGELARIPLCPKCGDTKFVVQERCTKCSIPYTPYICTKCNIRWESINRETNINGFPQDYIRGSW